MKDYNIYSTIDELPTGQASDDVTPGCLVLEGGALRGLYSSGVLDAMMEAGINMECTVGVSAGAMNGIFYVSGQIGLAARCNLLHRHDKSYISIWNRHKCGGLFRFEKVLDHASDLQHLDWDKIYRSKRKLYAVATNCLTGEPVYFDKDECEDLLRVLYATTAIPYLSKVTTAEGIPCLDGGCSAKIPYWFAREHGYDKNVIIRTRPSDWRYEKETSNPGARIYYRKYPEFVEKFQSSNGRYNKYCDEIQKMQEDGEAFVIAPSRLIPVKRLDPDVDKLAELYYLGYEDGNRNIPQLKDYLQVS